MNPEHADGKILCRIAWQASRDREISSTKRRGLGRGDWGLSEHLSKIEQSAQYRNYSHMLKLCAGSISDDGIRNNCLTIASTFEGLADSLEALVRVENTEQSLSPATKVER